MKDPNAPRKGMTAFLHFAQAKRALYKEEYPNLSHKEIISKLGENWNLLSLKEKEPFAELAKRDKIKYDAKKADYDEKKKKINAKSKGEESGDSVEKKIKK